jgi:polysaccharide biosynthesis PFTS motif protein
MSPESTNYKKKEVEESFFSMLEKSGMETEFRPIIFESLLYMFRHDSTDYQNLNGDFIYSSDQSEYNISTGALRTSRKRVLRGMMKSCLFIFALIVAASLPRTRRKFKNTALLFGFEERFLNSNKDIDNLIENLRGQLPSLFDNVDQILFESRNNLISSFLDSRSRNAPVLALRVLRDNFAIRSRWKIVLKVIMLVSTTIRRNWAIFFVAPDRIFLEFPIWQMMLTRLNFRLVTTQSKLALLPVLFYVQRSDRHIVWYSNNSLPFNREGHRPIEPKVAANSRYIDNLYVWSNSHKEFLVRQYPYSKVTVAGPIVFETTKHDTSSEQELKGILFFDVTPFENLEFETFYTPRMCSEAINDLADIASELGVRLHLKPKRPYLFRQGERVQHSRGYVDLLHKLESQNKVILLDSQLEVLGAILSTNVVIGLPFTSPVLLASQLKRPSIYYVPIDVGNWEIPPERDGIAVIQGKIQLLEYLSNLPIR